jgi:FMN phosphatase YigB (HAD superfamily)
VDGTLYEQGPLRRAMLRRLARECVARPREGIATLRALRAYRRAQEMLRGAPVQGSLQTAQVDLASQLSGQEPQAVSGIVERWMHREPLVLLGRFVEPALRRLLGEAVNRGIPLAVLSDYPAVAKLDAMGLSAFFPIVVCAQDPEVNRFKPHPAGLSMVLDRLGVKPTKALYVGDRHEVDAGVAGALRMPCVIVGPRRPSSRAREFLSVSNHAELYGRLFPATS